MTRTVWTVALVLIVAATSAGAGAEAEAAGSGARGRYLAGQGIIIPPEEVMVDSYIAQIDYKYPSPDGAVGAYLYTANKQLSNQGQESILHIGLQSAKREWDELPPMNLAFVVDTSASMSDENKLEWVQSAFELFVERLRPQDYLSLVAFSDTPQTLIPSTQVTGDDVKERFLDAVRGLEARGGSDLEAGLKAGYEQVMRTYLSDYTNRVLFLSDGTEISSRLSRAGGQTGKIRATLVWNNRNDLDLHMITPSGEEIFYANPVSASNGQLDVDMNVNGETTKPVENIFWSTYSEPPEGQYEVFVRNYGYHETSRSATEFMVELKSGNETSRFEGVVKGTGQDSDVVAFRFTYAADEVRKAEIYEIAEQYRGLGINVSTIGVGTEFDLDFMMNLARESGGSSRFIADRREMEEIFGSEFDRMVVSAARDLSVQVEFLTNVEILDTWGYDNEVGTSSVSYTQPTLHARDYETMVIRFSIPPGVGLGPLPLARASVEYSTLEGERLTVQTEPIVIHVVDSSAPVSGYSDATVLKSGTMMDLALRLVEIGELYYDAIELVPEYGDAVPAESRDKLERALVVVRLGHAELENASLRLDEDVFADEIGILEAYDQILTTDLAEFASLEAPEDPEDQAAVKTGADLLLRLPAEVTLETHIKHLVDEMILGFPAGGSPVVAVAGVTGGSESAQPIVQMINNGILTALISQSDFTVVERDRIAALLEEQELNLSGLVDTTTAVRVGRLAAADYVVTGTLIETSQSMVVFARVVNVETGVVESAAQSIVARE